MKKISTVGIIGLGAVGCGIGYFIQKSGKQVIAFKNKSKQESVNKSGIFRENIKIRNSAKNINVPPKDVFKPEITYSLDDLIKKADLILYCGLFPEYDNVYQLNYEQKEYIKDKKIPFLIFPGVFGANWMMSSDDFFSGIVAYSPVFSTREKEQYGKEEIINIKGVKSAIPLAYEDQNLRRILIHFFNEVCGFNKDTDTFVDGGRPLFASLGSPIAAINGAAICDNGEQLLAAKGNKIKVALYALRHQYAILFEEVFNEQLKIGMVLGADKKIPTIKDWLRNRLQKVRNGTISEMLFEIYKNQYVTISENDRRIKETGRTLLFFKTFAEEIGESVPAVCQLLDEVNLLKKRLGKLPCNPKQEQGIIKAAKEYARWAQRKMRSKDKRKEVLSPSVF
ncbi:2-dehydropantoate 2-reductase N-terminal domain-containing protein [Aquimarina hainanensis]|uniref:2-dehydropantoate 2-reductase N-terminal domain-containing protein n=1 Tax=Aquimarina hainanensis TaxID=1578017 RepID=A0ABW5N783_9FLAO